MAAEAASLAQADAGGSTDRHHGRAFLTDTVCQLSLFVPGKPVAKARPRTNRATGVTYTPQNTVTWEQTIGWYVRQQLAEVATLQGLTLPLPFQGRVIIVMRFNFDKPKSTPKRVTHKLKKPDYDNLAKSITDALQASEGGIGIFRDDSQVTDATILKRFSDPAHPQGVEIDLTCWLA